MVYLRSLRFLEALYGPPPLGPLRLGRYTKSIGHGGVAALGFHEGLASTHLAVWLWCKWHWAWRDL